MQKDWIRKGMPRVQARSFGGEKRRLGGEPALIRPAGHVESGLVLVPDGSGVGLSFARRILSQLAWFYR
jgi:hypothetical protein